MILLDENHRLDADKYQFIIQKRTVNQDKESDNFGKETWSNDAYLPKIEHVLRYMVNNAIKDNLDDVNKIIEAVNALESKFETLLKAKRG